MITTIVFLSACILNSGQCGDANSFEVKRVEVSPFDAIIFSDIAEIINDIDNNLNQNFEPDVKINGESESDEDFENLLSEYQNHLEKAQKQRVQYFEKTKGKNKVPLLRHEKFTKLNFPKAHSFDRSHNYHFSKFLPQKAFNNPYDLFVPLHLPREESLPAFNKIIWNENKVVDLPGSAHKSGNNAMLSSCFCEDNKFPCKCNCKQCLIPIGKMQASYFEPARQSNDDNPLITNSDYKNIGHRSDNTADVSDNNLNVRIKVDIQMPKINDVLKKLHESLSINATPPEDIDVNETITPMNMSFSSLTFPIPLNILTHGLSKLYQYDFTPIHKTQLHKKKKSHSSNQNKKYRSKFLTFHHGKGYSYQNLQTTEKYDYENFNNTYHDMKGKLQPNTTRVLELNSTVNKSDLLHGYNETNATIPILMNISTDENLIDIEVTTKEITNTNHTTQQELSNVTLSPPFKRIKREVGAIYKIAINDNKTISNSKLLKVKKENISQNNFEAAKTDNQQIFVESDLLYWPIESGKNMTIATREGQFHESNLNVSESTKNILNSTAHIEKSLSKVNWDDIDTVASMFTSLVGKYVNGVLTFCSQKICRSLKCADKTCFQRNCIPEDRFNKRGHCSGGSNNTDCTISTESRADVSLDIVSELIDNLQNKLMGQMFGKATICVNVKCITFGAVKKHFAKTKCLKKELKAKGHCENLKNDKMV